LRQTRKVDIIIDGKKITSKAEKIELKIDGISVYSVGNRYEADKSDVKDLQWSSVKSFLKAADSAFSHSDRFRIVKSLAESPRSFTEIKDLLNTTSATTNFHLKTLVHSMIAYKDENGRYALTLLGELVLDYFSSFLEEAKRLRREITSFVKT